jgi:putative ABC transport system permease protein
MELLRLLLRNVLRHKLRSLLTVLGVGVAVTAFALLRTVVTAWHAGVEASAANRLITKSIFCPSGRGFRNLLRGLS